MKIITLRGHMNTIILVTILVLNAFYNSDLGGTESIFNTISFLLVLIFLSLNLRFNSFLAMAFAIPLLFMFLSILVNAATLRVGGYHSALAISAGYALLTLKPPPLDSVLMKKLILVYLITALTLSLYKYSELLSTIDIIGPVANSNFNRNPNPAALFFFMCILLSLVFVGERLKWVFVVAFSVLVLTTGSRAGFVSTLILLAGFALLDRTDRRLFNWKSLLSKRMGRNLLILTTIFLSVFALLPGSLSLLEQRLSYSGFDIATDRGGGRDEIWKAILDVSLSAPSTILFGTGPATASTITDQGSHSSYVEAIGSAGWPFLIFTLFAVLCLFRYHKRHRQKDFLLFGVTILIYGGVSTELFSGLSSIWWVFIFLSLYYRSVGNSLVALRKPVIRRCQKGLIQT